MHNHVINKNLFILLLNVKFDLYVLFYNFGINKFQYFFPLYLSPMFWFTLYNVYCSNRSNGSIYNIWLLNFCTWFIYFRKWNSPIINLFSFITLLINKIKFSVWRLTVCNVKPDLRRCFVQPTSTCENIVSYIEILCFLIRISK